MPNVLHMTSCRPIDARRKCQRTVAGKSDGTSSIPGRRDAAVAMTSTYAPSADSVAVQASVCATSLVRRTIAPTIAATEMEIMMKYSAVR